MQKVIMWLSILAVIALAVLNVVCQPETTADAVFPMANQRIEWNYAGK